MTQPTASRPGDDSRSTARCPADSDDPTTRPGPPSGAMTLADLIDDSGPLPADAALECVERLAELLDRTPPAANRPIDATHVLIDDDGGLWLQELAVSPESASHPTGPLGDDVSIGPDGMNRLGRLLIYLLSGDARDLADDPPPNAATLPAPVSTFTARLFSRNGSGYGSYADVAADAANVRGGASLSTRTASIDVSVRPGPDTPNTAPGSASKGGLLAVMALLLAVSLAVAAWLWF